MIESKLSNLERKSPTLLEESPYRYSPSEREEREDRPLPPHPRDSVASAGSGLRDFKDIRESPQLSREGTGSSLFSRDRRRDEGSGAERVFRSPLLETPLHKERDRLDRDRIDREARDRAEKEIRERIERERETREPGGYLLQVPYRKTSSIPH